MAEKDYQEKPREEKQVRRVDLTGKVDAYNGRLNLQGKLPEGLQDGQTVQVTIKYTPKTKE